MLQNVRVAAFTVFALLRENEQDGGEPEGGGYNYPPPSLGLKSQLTNKINAQM